MRAFAVVGVLLVIMAGCTRAERVCTQIAALRGVSVTIEKTFAAEVSALRLGVCSDGTCTNETVALSPGTDAVDQGCTGPDPDDTCSATASPNGSKVGFVEVARLAEGPVAITATAEVSGRSRTYPQVTVTAKLAYPNGPGCGGEAPQVSVTLGPDGLRP